MKHHEGFGFRVSRGGLRDKWFSDGSGAEMAQRGRSRLWGKWDWRFWCDSCGLPNSEPPPPSLVVFVLERGKPLNGSVGSMVIGMV